MANVRDSDTSLWLHNKLGVSNDSWSGGSICSQLNVEVLRNIKECFSDLQTQVKLKLLLSFFHIPRRNLEDWKVELEQIADIAVSDSELWVSMLAESLKTYPSIAQLNTQIAELEEIRPIFSDLINDLRKLLRKNADNNVLLPLECHYLNKLALNAVGAYKSEHVKHFNIRKKQKSAILRAELLQKSNDAASNLNKKSSAPMIPVRSRGMPRKMTDTTPLKGIPSRLVPVRCGIVNNNGISRQPTSIARLAAGRKEGGVKLLDIADQPLGYGAAKKRKKMLDTIEDAKKTVVDTTTVTAAATTVTTTIATTPDYAAGLNASFIVPATCSDSTQLNTLTQRDLSKANTAVTIIAKDPIMVTTTVAVTDIPKSTVSASPIVSGERYPPMSTIGATVGPPTAALASQLVSVASAPMTVVNTPIVSQAQPITHIRIQPQTNANLQRRGLTLTREQMVEAQEMFRTANKVTRPEKALILSFMAGSRDNPCPHLGNIVTIKLSENQENVLQSDSTYLTMVAETHFQMNYNNGEWKRIKKYKHLERTIDIASTVKSATVLGS